MSAWRSVRLAAWNPPRLQPVATMSSRPPQSSRTNATTCESSHCSYRSWRRARSSSGTDRSDQVKASAESTQYSFTRPASSSHRTASTIPLFW
jgi:hypothetical protein